VEKKTIIQNYIDGWKTGNEIKILNSLSENCVITESHGPVYHGIGTVKKWIADWTKFNKIKKWDLISFYSFDHTVCFEWNFSYIGNERKEEFNGITIAKIENGKIVWLKEYRMTAVPYEWHPKSERISS